VQLGDTFMAGHLHIVCSEPTADGSVVVFNTTTPKRDSDRNCVVQPGDHPSVHHESVISYEHGRIWSRDQQAEFENSALYPAARRAKASPELLRKIQEGALRSDQTPIEAQDTIREQGAGS